MNRTKTAIAAGLLLLVAIPAVAGEAASPRTDTAATAAATNPEPAAVPVTPSSAATLLDNLIDLMVRKGVLSTAEVGTLKSAPADRQLADLIALLKQKGVVTDTEAAALPPATATPQSSTAQPAVLTASVQPPGAGTAMPQAATPKPEAPKVVTAIAPIRVLPLDPPKREGLIPDLKLGAVRLKPYGFFKTSVIYDTSQPRGIDFPLPQFLFGDTGPDASPEFHVKARSFRIGSNFEWMDIAPELTLTGRFEMDFEGNFTRTDNRNISSIRSSQPSIRLAWTRLDYRFRPNSSFFALFGQDWTPFGSSTLPNLVETTGLGIAFGTLYERAPQARFGFVQGIGGSGRGFKISPEIAVVLPGSGNPPSGTSFVIPTTPATTANVGLGVDTQLAIGERQGVDAARPEVQARVVTQFQLDKAANVPAAQLIVSGVQGEREAIVRNSDIPLPTGAGTNFRTLFPRGLRVGSERYGVSAEAQLPTRWVTLLAKYYRGADLRFYFAGQLFSFFNNTTGLTGTQTVPSIDGSAAVVLGLRGGVPTVAPQVPVRSAGGFVNVGFPISRWFNADPAGHNAGWSLYLHYGLDEALARDVRRASPGGARWKSDLISANLQYKLNNWVTFAYEQSGYRTFALPSVTTGVFPLFRGVPTRLAIDRRSEFATIFTF